MSKPINTSSGLSNSLLRENIIFLLTNIEIQQPQNDVEEGSEP